jgi:hypothetical protein
MMMDVRRLAGLDLQTQPVVTYTRLISGEGEPHSKDMQAWRWINGAGPELVFRSVLRPQEWVDRSQHEFDKAMLRNSAGIAFVNRRGYSLYNRPLKKGEVAWFNVLGKPYRQSYRILEDEHSDSGAQKHSGSREKVHWDSGIGDWVTNKDS